MFDCILSGAELVYYFMFIFLTTLILVYTVKTYRLEASRKYELLCKITIPNTRIENSQFYFSIEIYNAGNMVAKDVEVYLNGNYVTKFDFVKPDNAELFPIGFMRCMLSENICGHGEYVDIKRGDIIAGHLMIDGKKEEFSLNTDILFETRPADNYLREMKRDLNAIESRLKDINKSIQSIKKA